MLLGPSALHILAIAALLAAGFLSALLAFGAGRRRQVPGASALVALMVGAAIWALVYALELAAPHLATKIFWLKVEYIGIVIVPVAWLAFALDYTGRSHWLTRRRLAALSVVPLMTLLLALTNETHGLLWRAISLDTTGPFPALRLERGAWYWVNVVYAYLALSLGTVLLMSALLRAPRRYRQLAGLLLLGVAAPWLANALYIAGVVPVPNLDPTPLAFAIGGLAYSWGLFRFRFLDVFLVLVPIAREAVVDDMRDGVLVLDPQGRLADVNPAAERLIGLPAAVVLGQPAAQVLTGWPAAVVDQQAAAEAQITLNITDADGAHHYDLLISPLRRRDGRLAGRLVVARDVTERRQAEQRLALLAEASNALSSSLDYEATLTRVAHLVVPTLADYCFVDMIDEQRTIRDVAVAHVDPTCEDLLREMRQRYPPDPAASYGVAKVLRTGQPELIPELSASLLVTAAQDARHLHLFQTLDPKSYMIVPLIARGQMLGAISFGSTQAGRRYGHDDLALAEELARRAAVAIDNARLYADAQAAISLREEFLSIAAHELKTPLTTVKGYVQLSRRLLHQPALDQERLVEMQAVLERQVGRLERLVIDLLDIARIQRGQLALHRQPVDLVELARQVVERFEHSPERTPNHQLVFAADGPAEGTWDAERLDQVLSNLVSNALKYSPDGGEVRVQVSRCGTQAVLAVRDEGLGIAPDEQERLFRPFARGQAARGIEGVGLGLHITAEIVARHGGTLSVESAPGAGSTFTIRLPLTAAQGEDGDDPFPP